MALLAAHGAEFVAWGAPMTGGEEGRELPAHYAGLAKPLGPFPAGSDLPPVA